MKLNEAARWVKGNKPVTDPLCLITTTTDSIENARAIAASLLENQLAACVHIYPIESHYSWQGNLACDQEFSLHIKTAASRCEELRIALCKIHTYEIPQIIQLDITTGHEPYLDWVRQAVAQQESPEDTPDCDKNSRTT